MRVGRTLPCRFHRERRRGRAEVGSRGRQEGRDAGHERENRGAVRATQREWSESQPVDRVYRVRERRVLLYEGRDDGRLADALVANQRNSDIPRRSHGKLRSPVIATSGLGIPRESVGVWCEMTRKRGATFSSSQVAASPPAHSPPHHTLQPCHREGNSRRRRPTRTRPSRPRKRSSNRKRAASLLTPSSDSLPRAQLTPNPRGLPTQSATFRRKSQQQSRSQPLTGSVRASPLRLSLFGSSSSSPPYPHARVQKNTSSHASAQEGAIAAQAMSHGKLTIMRQAAEKVKKQNDNGK